MGRRMKRIPHLPFDLLRVNRQIVDGSFAYFPFVPVCEVPKERHDVPERGDHQENENFRRGEHDLTRSRRCAPRASANSVDPFYGLCSDDQAQVARPTFVAQPLSVLRQIEHHRMRWTILAMKELLSCNPEAECLVIRQQCRDAIDVALLDTISEAVPNHRSDQLHRCCAAALRFFYDEFRANTRCFWMMS